jgi:AbrB family looped-hinge helix DNA binding protein
VTIPKEIRQFLRVKCGDRVDFVINDEGKVIVKSGTVEVRELKGLLRRPGRRPVSLDAMEDAILRGGREKPR